MNRSELGVRAARVSNGARVRILKPAQRVRPGVAMSWFMRFTVIALLLVGAVAVADPEQGGWVATWTTANKVRSPFDAPTSTFSDVTLRQVVRVSVGGRSLRIWLSNEVGNAPLQVGAATVAPRASGSAIESNDLKPLTFGGASSIVIPAGARVLSDPVRLDVRHRAELAISIYLPTDSTPPSSPVTYHVRALQTSFIAPGNQVGEADLVSAGTTTAWYYLSEVDVAQRPSLPVIAAFGDSITDGDQRAAPNEPVDLNARYTDFLADRLLLDRRHSPAAVVNLGISGNQVTTTFIGENAVGRFDTDVLARSGVTHLVVLEGINDIGLPGLLTIIGIPTPEVSSSRIIAGLQQIATQARQIGIVVVGGTLTPSGGSPLPGYSGAAVEAKRQAVNTWIRSGGAFDAVVDFDAVLKDPVDPTRMRPDLTADGLHPNSDGYRLMADAVARVLRGRLGERH